MILHRRCIYAVHVSNRDCHLPPSFTLQWLPLPRPVSLLAFLQTVPWSRCLRANRAVLHRLILPVSLLTKLGSWLATSSSLRLLNLHYTVSPSKVYPFWSSTQVFPSLWNCQPSFPLFWMPIVSTTCSSHYEASLQYMITLHIFSWIPTSPHSGTLGGT